MMRQSITFSRRLFIKSVLVLLVGIGFWGNNVQAIFHLSSQNQNEDVPGFEDGHCKDIFPDFAWNSVTQSRFTCGFLITWENYENRTGTIRLAVMIAHPDPKLTRKTDPVIWLAGGPGDVGIILPQPYYRAPDQALFFADLFERDFVQFSQRGSKYSQPDLTCSQHRAVVLSNFTLQNSEYEDNSWGWGKWNADLSAALRFCIDKFNDDDAFSNIENYNSNANAMDVINLIHRLGDNQANLYSGSYGTLLAQHVLAISPADIRSVILDGVAPLGRDWTADYPSNIQRSLDEIFKSCNRDPDCKQAYPDLEPFFYQVLDQLKEQPARISVKDNYYEIDSTTNRRNELSTTYSNVYLDDYGFLIAFGNLLAGSDNIKEIPRIIYAAGNGHFKDIGNVYYSTQRNQDFAWGMYYSVYCTEFAQFKPSDPDQSQVRSQLRVLYTASGQFINEVCQDFGRNGKSFGNIPITDNHVPVLIFNGLFDPLTPPDYGAQVAEALSVTSEFNLTSEISSHGSSYSNNDNYNSCVESILRIFINHPDQPAAEEPCWKEMQVEGQKINFNTFNIEVFLHKLPILWEEFQNWLDQRWEEFLQWVDQQWEEFLQWLDNLLEQWWQDFQKQLIQWLEQLLAELLNQCLPNALLPLGVSTVVWMYRLRKRGKNS